MPAQTSSNGDLGPFAGGKGCYQQLSDAAWDVPGGLVWVTGGDAIRNTKDLAVGLSVVSAPPAVHHTLAYSPSDIKPDGKSHTLKVKLANQHGLTLDAYKGHFAPREVVSAQEQIDAFDSTRKRWKSHRTTLRLWKGLYTSSLCK